MVPLISDAMKSLLKPFVMSLLIAVMPVLVFYFFQQRFTLGYSWGLSPMNIQQIYGVLLMPLVHAGQSHLWGNTIQLFLVLFLIYVHFKHLAHAIVALQWMGAGLLLFFMGVKGSLHVGSSGVVYGLFGFLITAGFLSGNRRLRILALMLIMYYGSMVWGLFPWQEKVSWQGHLSGLITGLVAAFFLRNQYRIFTRDAKPDWFYEGDERNDPYARFDRKC